MKKRLFALLLALLLLFSSLPASAAGSVYFTAANDTLLELSSSTMPFWSGGYLYVASTVFSKKEFGILYSRNTGKKTVMLYTGRNATALIFDLNSDTCYDSQGEIYLQPCILRGGTVFLPVSLVSEIFGLSYTSTKIPYGYLIRIKGNAAVLSDSTFVDAASEQMAYRYANYQKGGVVAKPVTPTTVPPMEAEPDGKNLYLSFLVQDTAAAAELLDVLGSSHATFYFPIPLLKSAGDLTRRMLADGHAIGLAPESADILEELRLGNALLARNSGCKTRLVLLQNAPPKTTALVENAGYCPLSPKINNASRRLSGSANASALLKRINKKSGSVTVYLGAEVTGGGLRALLSGAREADDRFLTMTELI